MPAGLFDSFDNLDSISVENISCWLKNPPALTSLENYLATRLLYPQTCPITLSDMQIDLAILREAIMINGPRADKKNNPLLGDNPFLNITLRKILIPNRFLNFVPDLASIVNVFVDALLLNRNKEDWFQDYWTVVLTDETDEVIGSVVLPQFSSSEGLAKINSSGKSYIVKKGSLVVIPCTKDRCQIDYKMQNGNILGRSESALEVYGGRLGILVDGRQE